MTVSSSHATTPTCSLSHSHISRSAHLRLPERAGVVRDDVADGLPLADAGRQDRVHRRDGLLSHAHAEAAVDERALVVGLGAGGEIVLLAHRAVALGLAPVADVRGPREARAVRLEEVRARLEAARLVLPQPLAESRELLAHALVEARAQPVGASEALVAVDAPGDDLAHHGGVGTPDLHGDLRDLHSASEQELDAFPFVDSHVLCHDCSPCSLSAGRQQGTRPCPGGQTANMMRLRGTKRKSLPGEGRRVSQSPVVPPLVAKGVNASRSCVYFRKPHAPKRISVEIASRGVVHYERVFDGD